MFSRFLGVQKFQLVDLKHHLEHYVKNSLCFVLNRARYDSNLIKPNLITCLTCDKEVGLTVVKLQMV